MQKIKLIKNNMKIGYYIFEKNSDHFTEFILPNDIRGVYTTKNFYADTKFLKIRYSEMKCDNASYNELRDYYLEITDDVYLYMLIDSDDSHDSTIARLTAHSSAWEDLNQQAQIVIESAKEI